MTPTRTCAITKRVPSPERPVVIGRLATEDERMNPITRYKVHDPRLEEPYTTTDTERAARLARAGLRVTATTEGQR